VQTAFVSANSLFLRGKPSSARTAFVFHIRNPTNPKSHQPALFGNVEACDDSIFGNMHAIFRS
jgi:hypothetical protein